jgi:YegS/Rv2252/BmrU family lipid kinase
MKHLFIINPTAGGIKGRTKSIISKIRSHFSGSVDDVEIYLTKAPMDAASKIISEAKNQPALRVYACGGDGTLNECANGAAGKDNVFLCPFPIGTGNDFVKMFGKDALAMYRDLDVITSAPAYPIDLINCCGRYCINISSIGIDARIGTDVHKYSHLPIIGGATGYVTSLAVNIAKGINQHYKISCGSFQQDASFALICACNGTFYGGGFNPVPEAKPDDGMIDFLIVNRVSRLSFLKLVKKYAAGQYRQMPGLVTHLRARSMEVVSDSPIVVNVDGEALRSSKITFEIVPKAVNIVIPEKLAGFLSSNLKIEVN